VSAEPEHIRPEVRREVDEYLALVADVHALRSNLTATFKRRLAREGLTAAELSIVVEALQRKE
jgi:hypothetical protein